MSKSERIDRLERHFQTLARNQRRELAMHREVREQNRLLTEQIRILREQHATLVRYIEACAP